MKEQEITKIVALPCILLGNTQRDDAAMHLNLQNLGRLCFRLLGTIFVAIQI